MRKIILTIALNLFFLFGAAAQGAAEWNGSVSSDWNTAANWTWTGGSGVPGMNDDVTIRNGINLPHVSSNITANCKNMKIGKLSGDNVILYMEDSATINIYGNVTKVHNGRIKSVGQFDKTTTLNFLRSGNQTLDINEIRVGNINIHKSEGDVLLSAEPIVYIANTLNLKSQPVAIGLDPPGNLVMNAARLIFYADNPEAKITTSSYQDNQTPPHIITNSSMSQIFFVNDFTGDKFVPVSPNATSFNPVTIHSVSESWHIRCWGPPENQCDSFYTVDDAVRRTWIVVPTTGTTPKLTSNNPASISMTFQVNNVGHDVPANFNPHGSPLEIWFQEGQAQCWNRVSTPAPMPSTGYVRVTTPPISKFGNFAIAPDTTIPITSVIDPIGNAINDIAMYPNPAVNKLTFNLKGYSGQLLNIGIFDALGRVVFAKEVKNAHQINSYEVDMHHFNPGFYTVRLSDEGYSDIRKLVKR